MIKRNESDVGDIGFEILAKTVFQFLCVILFLEIAHTGSRARKNKTLCFILFLALTNSS